MKQSLKRKCELFAYNRNLANKNFKNTKSVLVSLMSEAYSSLLCVFDDKKALRHKENLKFKKFKHTVITDLISVRMSLNDNASIDSMYSIYGELKKRLKKHCREDYIQYAAYILSEYTDGVDSARAAHLATKQFESIRTRKKAMSCGNDLIISSLLSVCYPQNRYGIADDVAECIKELKERDVPYGTAKFASRILAFGKGVASARCDRYIRLLELLREREVKLGRGKETTVVALAALIDIPDGMLTDSIAEVNNYFKQSKEFDFETSEAKLAMYSVLIACDELISDIDDLTLRLIKEATLSDILSFGI